MNLICPKCKNPVLNRSWYITKPNIRACKVCISRTISLPQIKHQLRQSSSEIGMRGNLARTRVVPIAILIPLHYYLKLQCVMFHLSHFYLFFLIHLSKSASRNSVWWLCVKVKHSALCVLGCSFFFLFFLKHRTLLPSLLDRRRAEDGTNGLIEHRLQPSLSQSRTLQILHCSCERSIHE